jgi:hypothetical protein
LTLRTIGGDADDMDMATPHPDLAAVVELARLAPSVHNTQPWRFEADGDMLSLFGDETRRLRVLDPDARQQTISCGAALYLARLGLRLQGYDPVVEIPRPADGQPLARVRAVPGPQVTAEEVVLERAARTRHTQRAPFEERPVEPEVVTAIRAAVQEQGAWVRFLSTREEQVPVAVLLSHADDLETADEQYREELAAWTARPRDAQDGLTAEATDLGPGVRGSDLRLRDFAPHEGPPAPAGSPGDLPPAAEHPLVAVLGTGGDGPNDWLVAGQALCALLVQAQASGVQASPLGQVLDQPWTRRRLAGELGLVGHPQMVLRLGHAQPGPATPRRGVEDLLT